MCGVKDWKNFVHYYYCCYYYSYYYYYYYYRNVSDRRWFLYFFRLIIGQNYFGDAWNVLDFIIVLGSIADILYTELSVSQRLYRVVYNERII